MPDSNVASSEPPFQRPTSDTRRPIVAPRVSRCGSHSYTRDRGSLICKADQVIRCISGSPDHAESLVRGMSDAPLRRWEMEP